jgi:uncharacterized protein YbaP (TraB family)
LSRDLAGLVEMSERYLSSGDPVLAQRFRQRAVDERNQIMVRRMRPFLQQGGAFIAIGALHLPGRQGVLSLLEDNDFSVQRVY